jgi:hypothetical protein
VTLTIEQNYSTARQNLDCAGRRGYRCPFYRTDAELDLEPTLVPNTHGLDQTPILRKNSLYDPECPYPVGNICIRIGGYRQHYQVDV